MFKVQKESLILGLFMSILFMFSACETGGSKDTQKELDMIEGADEAPAKEDTVMDSLETEPLDSANISELRRIRDEGMRYKRLLDSIAEENPNISYTYVPGPEGKIKTVLGDYKVKIDGLETEEEETVAMLVEKKFEIRQRMINFYNNLKNTELAAVPVKGYEEFYNQLDEHMDFSKELTEVDAEGLIFVQMAIEKNGEMSNPRISENISHLEKELEEEISTSSLNALKEIKMKWIPAQRNGEPVRSRVEIPIWIDADPGTQS